MLRSIFMMTLVAGWLGHPAAAAAPQNQEPRKQALEVVATIPDLADICVAIGGDAVRVKTLVPAGNDPHAVLPKASLLLHQYLQELTKPTHNMLLNLSNHC